MVNFSNLFKVLGCCGLLLMSLQSFAAPDKAKAQEEVKPELTVCAVPQFYNALERLKLISPFPIAVNVQTSSDLYADLANTPTPKCHLLLSSDERLPLKLANTGKLDADKMKPFLKVKLLLWSPNPRLINQSNALRLFTEKRLKSVALAKAELNPVGFAANEVLRHHTLKAGFLSDNTYRATNEYQVYSIVNQGHVEAGFITTPLVYTLTRQSNGSYWVVPEDYYPTIQYYATVLKGSNVPVQKAEHFVQFMTTDKKAIDLLEALGFFQLK